jgi:hypothetical protein
MVLNAYVWCLRILRWFCHTDDNPDGKSNNYNSKV